jgi:hypothetical protein
MNTYQERIGRYRIVYHEELPESHKAELRLLGIDPDARRILEWSFDDKAAAEEMLTTCILARRKHRTYFFVDAKTEITVERELWF